MHSVSGLLMFEFECLGFPFLGLAWIHFKVYWFFMSPFLRIFRTCLYSLKHIEIFVNSSWWYSYFSWLLLIEKVLCLLVDGVCTHVCVFWWRTYMCWNFDEFFDISPGKVFEAWVRVFLQRGKCLLPAGLWIGATKSRTTYKFSAWFFVVVCMTIRVMGIPFESLAYYEFIGEFFSSCYWAVPFGQVYFWFAIMLIGIGIWDSRFIGEWLDNMHSLHLNLDFVCPALHLKIELCGHQVWHLLEGWKQMEHLAPVSDFKSSFNLVLWGFLH